MKMCREKENEHGHNGVNGQIFGSWKAKGNTKYYFCYTTDNDQVFMTWEISG